MDRPRHLSIAYTPDSDDAFYYDALENGLVRPRGWSAAFTRDHMRILNRDAVAGRHHVTAISSVIYPKISGRYAILSVGTSVGRGYGPVLVGREKRSVDSLKGKQVAVPGIPTTGWFLLRCICPEAIPVEMDFDEVAGAIARGEVEAGVMIHEELLYYPTLGLEKIIDLGADWCERHGLPLPVGLNVIRRDLGTRLMAEVGDFVRQSLEHGMAKPEEALRRVSRFGRGRDGGCTNRFVQMFANQDSLNLPADAREGLRVLFNQVSDLGLGDPLQRIDIIEAGAPVAEAGAARAQ